MEKIEQWKTMAEMDKENKEISMEAITKVDIIVSLKMNKEEALWLKDIMQNPLNIDGGLESQKTLEMRSNLFNALSNCADLNLMEE